MKRKINILCGLLIAVVVLTALYALYFMGLGFNAGMNATDDFGREDEIVTVSLMPDSYASTEHVDTLAASNGMKIPAMHSATTISIAENQSSLMSSDAYGLIVIIFSITEFVFVILMIADLLKFVIAVNHDRIFEPRNVKLLRLLGIYSILTSIAGVLKGVLMECYVASLPFTIRGYSMSAYWVIPWEYLIFGLLALLISQIWRRAMIMQEEQRLTI